MKTLLINTKDIEKLISIIGIDTFMDKMISSLESKFLKYDDKKIEVRKRDGFLFKNKMNSGVLEWMPVTENEHSTIKIVSYNPENPTFYNIPTIISTISLFDINTGHLVALADGNLLTAVRTGAASAIASKILGHEKSEILGLIGCGCQAVTQLHALSRVFKFSMVYVYDIDKSTALSFLERTKFSKLNIKIVPRHILEAESDIICTATSVPMDQGPVLNYKTLKKHVHINSVGSDLPNKTEVPLKLLKRSFVCPDFLPQALVEGECQQLASSEIGLDIIKLVKEKDKYIKSRCQETVFDSTGFALEDQVAMNILVEFANKYKLGKLVEIENISNDPKNPYYF